MVESLFVYLGAFAIVSLFICLADTTSRGRLKPQPRRNSSASFTGLNVPSKPVTLEEIRRREQKEQLDEVSREIVNVSRLIESYVQAWDMPPDGLDRLIARKERLLVRYDRLVDINLHPASEALAVVVPVRIRTPKALPSAGQLPVLRGARPRRSNSSNNIS